MVPSIAAAELAFIDPLFHWLFTAISFFGEHIVPWFLPFVLVKECIYLCSKERRKSIFMLGWGTATRAEQPLLYYWLWFLHLAACTFFALLFVYHIGALVAGH